ncbi:23S rRNA (guanosine(2251)-2'-O)-methyltransferase RlmB [Bacteroidota bacterium]|nr:23S rRNA (guanosine(2251)-2'-O)-methyltransferase RlmB [Bacteroidota bacterium]
MEKNTEIYGIRAVIEAINSSKDIDKVFIQTGLKGKLIGQLESIIRKNKINFSYVPTQKLDRLSKKNHQGVIARIAPIKFYTIESFSEVIEKSKNPFILILDQINDVRNFGAIIRTAEISGVDGIIIQNSSSAPVNSDTIKTSAGAIFNIPICKVNHIKDAIYHLQSMNISIISASEKSEKNIYDVDLKGPLAIIMGSEHKGINKSVINLSNESVKLPMYGKIESLNVSVACGIFLYEVVRQRI